MTADPLQQFSDQLNRLDPTDDAFVLHVDELVEQTPDETLQNAYPAIFAFFEKHPLEYCGLPGTLVHMIEDYYPIYVSELISSVARAPSVNCVWMVNRILNSKIDGDLRDRLIESLVIASQNDNAPSEVREEAAGCAQRQTENGGLPSVATEAAS